MESIYGKVVKLTAEILKSWTSNPGVVSPFSSSSSSHSEPSDNHLEHYVQQNVTTTNEDISSMFNSDLFTNGGETMTTEKTLDVETSTTTETAYNMAGTSTTEPDPQSQIAITKSAEIEPTTVGTTANTTTEAPASGETTEPMAKAASVCQSCGGDACPDCNKAMHLCACDGMSKSAPADGSDSTTENTTEIEKSAGEAESAKEEESESSEDEAKEQEMKKLADDAENYFAKKQFSDRRRKELAHDKKAMPDGSFPIESEEDLKNAIQAVGRAKDYDKAKAHIISRAKAMGKTSLLPDDWTKNMAKSAWGGFFVPVD